MLNETTRLPPGQKIMANAQLVEEEKEEEAVKWFQGQLRESQNILGKKLNGDRKSIQVVS